MVRCGIRKVLGSLRHQKSPWFAEASESPELAPTSEVREAVTSEVRCVISSTTFLEFGFGHQITKSAMVCIEFAEAKKVDERMLDEMRSKISKATSAVSR